MRKSIQIKLVLYAQTSKTIKHKICRSIDLSKPFSGADVVVVSARQHDAVCDVHRATHIICCKEGVHK